MASPKSSDIKFEGEEADAGFASPTLDLVATVVLIGISVAMMAASWALPMPGDIHTAPGLLPFFVSLSLLIMALGLGASALARKRSGVRIPVFADRDIGTDLRSLALAGAVAIYISVLHVLAFQTNVTVLGATLKLTAFEPATIVTLCVIMRLSWRGPIWIITLISVAWTLILSLVFQMVFRIPLPGSF